MDVTMSGKLVVKASKKVIDSIWYAFSEDEDVEDIIEVDEEFFDLQGEFCEEDIVREKNSLTIPFGESYEIFDSNKALDLVKQMLTCFPSIRSLEFEGTENVWSSGEFSSFKICYKDQVLSVASSPYYEESDLLSEDSEEDIRLAYVYEENEDKPFELMPVGEFKVENFDDQEIPCDGFSFCVTGKLHIFENREAIEEYIEDNGGNLVGSVSANTDFLINNDIDSTSSKNKKAQELGIPIISEEKFVALFGE